MKFIFSVVLAVFILFLLIRFLEYKSLYFPFENVETDPKEIGLDYEDAVLTAKDGVLLSGGLYLLRTLATIY
jgi:hypothetical protein